MTWEQLIVPVLTLSGALLTAIITGTITIIASRLTNNSNTDRFKLQFEYERQKEKGKIILEKGEELYHLVLKWKGLTSVNVSNYVLGIVDAIDAKTVGERIIENFKSEDYSRMQLIFSIYFNELKGEFDELNNKGLQAYGQYLNYITADVTEREKTKGKVALDIYKFLEHFNKEADSILERLGGMMLDKLE